MIHEVVALLNYCEKYIKIDDKYFELCEIASEFYKDNRYPSPQYTEPDKDEIKDILEMAEILFNRIKEYIMGTQNNNCKTSQ